MLRVDNFKMRVMIHNVLFQWHPGDQAKASKRGSRKAGHPMKITKKYINYNEKKTAIIIIIII